MRPAARRTAAPVRAVPISTAAWIGGPETSGAASDTRSAPPCRMPIGAPPSSRAAMAVRRPAGNRALAEAPQVEFVDRSARRQQHAHEHEEGGLHEAVTHDIDHEARQADRRQGGHAGHHDADVGDGREGQQPLQVPLRPGHDAAYDRGHAAERQQQAMHDRQDLGRAGEDLDDELRQDEQGRRHHGGREDHRNGARGDRMRVREPEVERHDGGLDEQRRRYEAEAAHDHGIAAGARDERPIVAKSSVPDRA